MTIQQKFNHWLDNIVQTEKPGNDIVVFCFGIYEASDSYEAYLTGSNVFDDKNLSSACQVNFSPKHKYTPLGWNGGDPQLIVASLKQYLDEYIQTPTFKGTFLDRSTAIVYGMDRDTLYRLK